MPTYEFLCLGCGASTDVRAAVEERDAVRPVCSDCGRDDLRRAFATVAVASGGATPPSGGGCCGGGCCN